MRVSEYYIVQTVGNKMLTFVAISELLCLSCLMISELRFNVYE